MAAITGALIGAGANLLGNLLGNAGSKKRQDQSNQWNLDMWNKQNAYNHPSQQMARLKEAGLNPRLIYGTSPSSAVGQADKVAPSQAADYKMENPLNGMSAFVDLKQKQAQTNNLMAQNALYNQDAALKAMQTSKIGIETARNKLDYETAKALQKTSIDFQKETLRQAERKTVGLELDNQFKDESIKSRLLDVMYRAQNAKETLQGTRLQNEIHQLDIQLKKLGIEKNDPWYFRLLGRHLDAIRGYENYKIPAVKRKNINGAPNK